MPRGTRLIRQWQLLQLDRAAGIVDYKTGWYRPDDFTATFPGDRLLQHALYGVAATQLLKRRDAKARESGSAYYLPTARGQAERITYPAAERKIDNAANVALGPYWESRWA